MTDLFDESDASYTGPPLVEQRVREAEALLGVRLPRSYLTVLQQRNGGVLRRACCPTDFPTSWAEDHFEVRALLGIGGVTGIDSTTGQGSVDLIREWGYPDIGVVICDLPSGGHDTVMLDYTDDGPDGEPAVAYVDEDRVPRRLADTSPPASRWGRRRGRRGRRVMLPPPSRADVRARLLALLAGRAGREEVADWAVAWVADPAPEVDDPVVWRCLVDLSGADLRTGPETYLHGELDVRAWLDALDSAEEGRSGRRQEHQDGP